MAFIDQEANEKAEEIDAKVTMDFFPLAQGYTVLNGCSGNVLAIPNKEITDTDSKTVRCFAGRRRVQHWEGTSCATAES